MAGIWADIGGRTLAEVLEISDCWECVEERGRTDPDIELVA
jgi:hypothetical protein